ncbi:uncharacterized protein GGS22DRAFT_120374 [Annulohypoxylon maeteangense]|uniref:uncharacterized protein n=1 Tax=Annulohypoxylon maeteangense TaxID=1927788 RepID=UPI0020084C95|nr:uncharacterized protein GGS22DRAFT_120374 [Annulohypoxylon maeteangense]KAI0887001.1 hypothetical protein GGS22DRAFT_120374 [Annulohypoxylon maeteangense]
MLLADLRKKSQAPAYLSFLDFERHSQEISSKLAGVRIRHGLASAEDLAQTLCLNRKRYIKASIKGHKMASQAAKHFNSKEHADSIWMKITETALICGPPYEGHVKESEGVTSFQKTQFRSKDSVSSQYLHFSVGSQSLQDRLVKNGKSMYDRVCLQSGMCLFSMDMVRSSLDSNGRVDVSRLICATPTFYEAEYIARTCPVIADLCATILDTTMRARGQTSNAGEVTLRVGLDVPNFHYFHSVQSKLQDQTCTFPDALQWMRFVIERHRQMAEVFQGYLLHQLARRGVGASQMNIEASRRGIPAADYILEALERSEMPSFDEILKLLGEEDDTWNEFWDMLPPKERAVDFRSLSNLFYVYEVIRPSLEGNIVPVDSRPNSEANIGRLVIGIDDSAERQIYSRSQKLLKKIRNHPEIERLPYLMEIYMSRRVFINGNEAGSNLYLDDPSPQNPIVVPWKPLGAEEDELQATSSDFGPYDLAGSLHGEDASKVLRELFNSVGLS